MAVSDIPALMSAIASAIFCLDKVFCPDTDPRGRISATGSPRSVTVKASPARTRSSISGNLLLSSRNSISIFSDIVSVPYVSRGRNEKTLKSGGRPLDDLECSSYTWQGSRVKIIPHKLNCQSTQFQRLSTAGKTTDTPPARWSFNASCPENESRGADRPFLRGEFFRGKILVIISPRPRAGENDIRTSRTSRTRRTDIRPSRRSETRDRISGGERAAP